MRDDKSKIGDCKGISNIKLGTKRQGAALLAIIHIPNGAVMAHI